MELWTADQAAQHWGVTTARARGLLSSRHIHRISGYPADAVRAVRRQQGARTDLTPPQTALTAAQAAEAIASSFDDTTRLRVFFEFSRGADEAGAAALPLITAEPPLIGDPRFDALLAAAAEHIATRHGLPGPLWTLTVERFLYRAWWISTLPSARVQALLWTSASFRRRGIYLERRGRASAHRRTPARQPRPAATRLPDASCHSSPNPWACRLTCRCTNSTRCSKPRRTPTSRSGAI